jgi:hypothetical protein
MLTSELLPGSIQGCFVSTEPEEAIVVLIPERPRAALQKRVTLIARLKKETR